LAKSKKKSKNSHKPAINLRTDASTHLPGKKFKSPRITLEESWKFLTDITEKVMMKFSKNDQQKLLQIGKVLAAAGMIYQHVIEYGVRAKVQQLHIDKEGKDEKKKNQQSR
jgi:hypothetical protein